MIAIIDCGIGNVQSVKNALDCLGVESVITSSASNIGAADRVVLPGVGAFGAMMEALRERGLIEVLKDYLSSGKPFLGICLGMQALFETSEESPGVSGLGVLKGSVQKFNLGKVPQMGWNTILPRPPSLLAKGYGYFANSYYVVPADPAIVTATSEYGCSFACTVESGSITAVQFHPEKSGDYGLQFLERWLLC